MNTTCDVEDSCLNEATKALQAQERLVWSIGKRSNIASSVKEKARTTLDAMREVKAGIEGSDVDFVGPTLKESGLVELKQLTLMHVPSSVTQAVKEKFYTLVHAALQGQCRSIECIVLLTCPWYELSQRERGEQARHNILLVVFVSHDSQFFSPANPQVKEKASVIDLGWLCAVELTHFGQALGRGRTRYIETVFCRHGADIYSSENLSYLKDNLDYFSLTGTRTFSMAALGQAVGVIGKKKKTGCMKLRDGSTVFEICESLRLLQLADNSFSQRGNFPELQDSTLSPPGNEAVDKLKTFYDHPNPINVKQELFDSVHDWSGQLKKVFAQLKGALLEERQTKCEVCIGEWMLRTRLNGRQFNPAPEITSDQHGQLVKLMATIAGPVSHMKPEQIVLVAVAGSAMYGLNIEGSDVDYLVVYSHPTETLLSATKKPVETYESRGLDKQLEYGAYEVRTFSEMLLKCSVVILELLFADGHEYMSQYWHDLARHKKSFVTEKAIQQYLGLVKNNFKMIDSKKLAESPKRDRKLFYQIFHKLHSVNQLMKGQVPEVKVQGEVRDFIMKVRTQDSGEFSRDELLIKARKDYEQLRVDLGNRTQRLPENPDYTLSTQWLLTVRGLLGNNL